jgi:hypothetical protein
LDEVLARAADWKAKAQALEKRAQGWVLTRLRRAVFLHIRAQAALATPAAGIRLHPASQ